MAVAGAAAALSVGLLAPAATAGEQAPVREAAPAGSDPNGTDYEISGLLSLDGTIAKLTNLTSVSQVVDSLGRAIGSPKSLTLKASSGQASRRAPSRLLDAGRNQAIGSPGGGPAVESAGSARSE